MSSANLTTIKVLGVSGSIRKASTHSGILRAVAAALAKTNGEIALAGREGRKIKVEFKIADISQLPVYSGDLDGDNAPAAVSKFREEVAAADAFLFASTEHNFSISAALKNALDWSSTRPSNGWAGKAAGCVGAGGQTGTVRSQVTVRQVGVFLNLTFVNTPEVLINRFGTDADAFNGETGDLVSDKWTERVVELLGRVAVLGAQLKFDPTK